MTPVKPCVVGPSETRPDEAPWGPSRGSGALPCPRRWFHRADSLHCARGELAHGWNLAAVTP